MLPLPSCRTHCRRRASVSGRLHNGQPVTRTYSYRSFALYDTAHLGLSGWVALAMADLLDGSSKSGTLAAKHRCPRCLYGTVP
jgi:hypothetical protein